MIVVDTVPTGVLPIEVEADAEPIETTVLVLEAEVGRPSVAMILDKKSIGAARTAVVEVQVVVVDECLVEHVTHGEAKFVRTVCSCQINQRYYNQ